MSVCMLHAAAMRGTTHTTPDNQSPSPAQSAATTDNEEGEAATQTFTRVVRDYQALGIVLPVALLTTVINALLIGASMYIYVFLRRRQERGNGVEGKIDGYENLECSTKSQLAEVRNNPSASASDNSPSKE